MPAHQIGSKLIIFGINLPRLDIRPQGRYTQLLLGLMRSLEMGNGAKRNRLLGREDLCRVLMRGLRAEIPACVKVRHEISSQLLEGINIIWIGKIIGIARRVFERNPRSGNGGIGRRARLRA